MNEWVCGNEYGTDLNRFSECANKNNIKRFFRNFGYFWSDTRRSVTDPCSGNYHGEYAFSEPETRAIRVGALMKKLEEVRYKTFRMCLGKEREM